jgi:hypothetical protein
MRLCACGCRDARHEELGKGLRGACLRCGCGAFEDVKTSIEEEVPAVSSLARVLADHNILELFEAWRCDHCGSRSWKGDRCNVLPGCRGRWMAPVTVEIRRREVIGGH